MAERDNIGTNIDNVQIPYLSGLLTICMVWGFVNTLAFFITLFGGSMPGQDIYYSPTAQAKIIRSIPQRIRIWIDE